MPSVTAYSICADALRRINAIDSVSPIAPADLNLAFDQLNDLIDSVSNDPSLLYREFNDVFPLVAGQSSYTIGVGGDFNTTRPIILDQVYWRQNTTQSGQTVDFPIKIMNFWEYSQIPVKTIPSLIPLSVYLQPADPLSTLIFYPIPTSDSVSVVIWSKKVLTKFANVNSSVSLPPGYNLFLKTTLAVVLAPYFERTVPDSLISTAIGARDSLVSNNMELPDQPIKFSNNYEQISLYPFNPHVIAGS